MKHQNSIDLLTYWTSIRGAGDAPERSIVQPKDIAPLLPWIILLDLDAGRPAFRLAGTAVCSAHMREMKGRPFSETWGSDSRQIELAIEAVGNDLFGAVIGSRSDNGKETISFETLLLPLLDNGRRGTRLVGVQSHFGSPWSLGGYPSDRHELVSLRFLSPETEGSAAPTALHEGSVIDFSNRRREPVAGRRIGHLTVIEGGGIRAGA